MLGVRSSREEAESNPTPPDVRVDLVPTIKMSNGSLAVTRLASQKVDDDIILEKKIRYSLFFVAESCRYETTRSIQFSIFCKKSVFRVMHRGIDLAEITSTQSRRSRLEHQADISDAFIVGSPPGSHLLYLSCFPVPKLSSSPHPRSTQVPVYTTIDWR